MRIGEVARQAGVNIQTIRFYERRGLLKEPHRRPSGYRDYSAAAIRRVQFIKSSQSVGFTLQEIQALIRLREQRVHSAEQVRAVGEAKIRAIDEKIHQLQTMRNELDLLLRNCNCGPRQPICGALEAMDV